MKDKTTKHPSLKYDIETAYQAAATMLSFILCTGESFVIRDFDIRDDKFEFEYCYPAEQEDADTREVTAFLCELAGYLAGHALYTGEILSSKKYGIDEPDLTEHFDNQVKILIDLCQNEFSGFFQEMLRALSKCGRQRGDRIERIFLKNFDGELGEDVDVEFRHN